MTKTEKARRRRNKREICAPHIACCQECAPLALYTLNIPWGVCRLTSLTKTCAPPHPCECYQVLPATAGPQPMIIGLYHCDTLLLLLLYVQCIIHITVHYTHSVHRCNVHRCNAQNVHHHNSISQQHITTYQWCHVMQHITTAQQ